MRGIRYNSALSNKGTGPDARNTETTAWRSGAQWPRARPPSTLGRAARTRDPYPAPPERGAGQDQQRDVHGLREGPVDSDAAARTLGGHVVPGMPRAAPACEAARTTSPK